MCTYCMIGDSLFRHNPPWPQHEEPWHPHIPAPLTPSVPWNITQLKEFQEILKRVKELEDKLGCPCEPNKADYIGLFDKRIKKLERQLKAKKKK